MAERIEPLTESHLNECAHIIVSAFNTEPWNESWTFDTARKTLHQSLETPDFVGFVSIEDEVIGFATGCCEQDDTKDVFCLETLCVKPDVQGRGVGSRLLELLKVYLEERGINTVYLITHRDTPAESFYKKNGYRLSKEDIVMICEW